MNQQVRVEHGAPLSSNTIRIQIGDVCCAITCHDKDVLSHLSEQYRNFLTEEPADISIKLDTVDALSTTELEDVLPRVEAIHKDFGFATTHLTFEGEYDATSRTLNMIAEKHLFDPALQSRIMNRVMPLAYFTASRIRYGRKPPPMLIHACSIVRHGQALIFTGPSGTGKTTIARLCGDTHGRVLNDEMVLCSWLNGNGLPLMVRGTPILGGVAHQLDTAHKLNFEAPLRCIIMLRQSDRTALRRLERMESYLRLMRQVIAPRDFNDAHDDVATLISQTTEFSDMVTKNVPFYELEFTLDRDLLWKAVDELEESLTKGELVA